MDCSEYKMLSKNTNKNIKIEIRTNHLCISISKDFANRTLLGRGKEVYKKKKVIVKAGIRNKPINAKISDFTKIQTNTL